MSVDHWMTFGTFAEQRHFIYPRADTYQGVLINGNMAAYAPAGMASFLLEKTPSLPYIIDPQTHAFQHKASAIQNRQGNVKVSIQKLAQEYGNPIKDLAGVHPVLPQTFATDETLEPFVKRCLEFQRNILRNAMLESNVAKYLDVEETDIPPYALVAPYFYMSEVTVEQWLPVCKKSAEMAIAFAPHEKVFGAVVLTEGALLSDGIRAEIVTAFADLSLAGVLIWVDDFDEHEASSKALKGLLDLSRGLRNNGQKEVLNLHGGYFSVLAAGALGGASMTGVAHGPEFGESRTVVPVGGGIPISRYYMPHLHARIRYRDALSLLAEKNWLRSADVFHSKVCGCAECRAALAGDPANFTLFGDSVFREVRRRHGIVRIEYPTNETKLRCLRHYLQRKALEYEFTSSATVEQQGQDLDEGIAEFEEVAGIEGVSHLRIWKDVLTGVERQV